MIREDSEIAQSPGGWPLHLLLAALALAGLAINVLLLTKGSGSSDVIGCGGDGCAKVLTPPWSVILGLPVALFGTIVYAAVSLTLWMPTRPLLGVLSGAITGAAVWFVFVQVVLLESYCPWCMAGHAVGITFVAIALIRQHREDPTSSINTAAAVTAVVVAGSVGAIQFFSPGAGEYLDASSNSDAAKALAEASASGIYSRGEGRKITFGAGKRTFDLSAMPRIGPANAKAVIVELFDYQCPSCRVMQGFIDALLAKYPEDVCVIVLPVPLERACNPAMGPDDTQFPDSCKLTELALAVWRKKPEEFPTFHRLLLAGATLDEARDAAMQWISKPELEAALQDYWITELITSNAKDCAALSAANNKLPKLMVGDSGLIHGLPPGKTAFIQEMEKTFSLFKP